MAMATHLSVGNTLPVSLGTTREGEAPKVSFARVRSSESTLREDSSWITHQHHVINSDFPANSKRPDKPKRAPKLSRLGNSLSVDFTSQPNQLESLPVKELQRDRCQSLHHKHQDSMNSQNLTVTVSVEEDVDKVEGSPLSLGVPDHHHMYLDGPQKAKSPYKTSFTASSLSQDSLGTSLGKQQFQKHPLSRSKNQPIKLQSSSWDAPGCKTSKRVKSEPPHQRRTSSLPGAHSKSPGSPRMSHKKMQTASDVAVHVQMDMIDTSFRNFQIDLSTKPQHWLESYKDKHWADVVMKGKSVEESEKTRRNKVWDLLHTELVFFTSQLQPLKLVFRNFLVFLQNQSPPVLKEVDVTKIFGNLDDVYELSVQVSMDLLKLFKLKSGADVAKPDDVVATFKMFGMKFNPVYQRYGLNFESSKEYRDSLYLRPLFTKFIKIASSEPICKNLKLDDFLLAPVKHLAHYPMLLEKIVKYTPGNSTKSLLQSALQAFKVSLKELESNMDDYKRILRLNEVQKVLHWPTVADVETSSYIPQSLRFKLSEQPCERFIVSGHQTIHHEGDLRLIGHKGQTVKKLHTMLFKSFVIFTENVKVHSQKRLSVFRQPFPLSEMTVHDIPDSEMKRSFACIIYSQFNQHIGLLVLQAESPSEKESWLQRFASAIEDAKLS